MMQCSKYSIWGKGLNKHRDLGVKFIDLIFSYKSQNHQDSLMNSFLFNVVDVRLKFYYGPSPPLGMHFRSSSGT